MLDIEKLPRRMMRWRKRFEAEEGDGGWVGIGVVKNAVGLDKTATRFFLEEYAKNGLVEKAVCENGIFWRGILCNEKIDSYEKGLA